MATADQYADWIVKNQSKRGSPEFDTVAAAYKEARAEPTTPQKEEGGFVDGLKNAGLGALKGATDIGTTLLRPVDAALNATGLSDMTNEQRRESLGSFFKDNADTDSVAFQGGALASGIAGTAGAGGLVAKPLMAAGKVLPYAQKLGNAIASGGFTLGNEGGNILANAGTRLAGGAINGGVSAGLINPDDAGTGAAIGAAIPTGAKIIGKAGGIINSAVKPFSESGRNKILGDLLLDKAGNDPSIIANLRNANGNTPGFNPTVGQASNSPDLATLERVFRDKHPSLVDVSGAQNEALANAVRGIGGDDLARKGLVDARTGATESLYKQAAEKPVEITPELQGIMQRPSMQSAITRAQNLAREKEQNLIVTKSTPEMAIDSPVLQASGAPFQQVSEAVPANMNGANAQYLKMGLDDMINSAPQTGITGNELRAIQSTKGDYLGQLESQIPEYLQANRQFAELSKPINQLDLGTAIADKYVPAIYRDVPVPNQLNHTALAKVLNDNGDKLAANVTGFKGATLENTLRPDQLEVIRNAVKDANYIKNGQLKGKPVGSNTFQNLAFNGDLNESGLGVLSKYLGPVASILDAGRGVAYKGANEKLSEKLAELLLNPQSAAEVMQSRYGSGNQKLIEMLRNPALIAAPSVMSAQ